MQTEGREKSKFEINDRETDRHSESDKKSETERRRKKREKEKASVIVPSVSYLWFFNKLFWL